MKWRSLLSVLPLPMLALSASYGIYSFNLLFVPAWVALASAASYELTYVGLSVLTGLDDAQRRRARSISIGAVIVSVLYNSLAGLFHRMPTVLDSMGLWGNVVLAILHGAPLAWVAFLVSDLLLHRQTVPAPANIAHASNAHQASMDAEQCCPRCATLIPERAKWLAARRWNRCDACRDYAAAPTPATGD